MNSLNIDRVFLSEARRRLDEQEHRMSLPETAANHNAFRSLIKSHARLKKIVTKAESLIQTYEQHEECRLLMSDKNVDEDLLAIAQEESKVLNDRLPALERDFLLELIPPEATDNRNTIIEIRAGAGGQEAAIFAGDLMRMYQRYAENQGWQIELIDASPSESGGYKEVIFALQGEGAYRLLQFEAGTHRVQRIPVTEASGRIHTSTVTVAVLPEAEDIDEIEIKPDDLRVDVYRASGAGGQHVNKTDSAVRITHIPTGIVAASQEERSQHKNRAKAMRVLRSRLLAIQKEESNREIGEERRLQIGSGERSERIRTYNFPQNRLTDHRINYTAYNLTNVMEGDIEEILEALQHDRVARKLKFGINLQAWLES